MYELFTLGGGVYLVDLLNAVAAITGGGAYLTLAQLAGVAGLAWILFRTAFGGSWKDNAKWVLMFVAVWGAMIVPKATVRVVDRLDPALAPAVVANVPIGLALFASLTSEVGDGLTRLTEQAFTLPNDLTYQRHGMIFGSRLADAVTRMEITDAVFARNVRNFARQCIFHALLLGHISADDLRETTDLWALVTNTGSPSAGASPARLVEFATRGPTGATGATPVDTDIVTCAESASRLTGQWTAEIDRATGIFGLRLFPGAATEALARAELIAALPVAHDFLIGASRSAAQAIQQQMLLNAIHDAGEQWASEAGNAAALSAYTETRAEAQTVAAYRAIGRQAETWVPLLRIVFECLYVGAFPMAVLLMLTPAGGAFFRAYLGGFIWLQSWGPLYAILHRIALGEAAERMTAAALMPGGDAGISLVAQAGIRAVAADVAVMSGYLSMSVPFLAAALAYGVGRATSLASSVLHVGQEAAIGAAREGSTGNLSLGSTQVDSHRFATLEGRQVRTSAQVDTGRYSGYTPEGAAYTVAADGTAIADAAVATSRLPAAGIRLSESLAASHENRAAQSRTLAENFSAEAAQARTAAATDATAMVERHARDVNVGTAHAHGVTESESGQVQDLSSHVDRLSELGGITKDQAATLTAEASLGGGFGKVVRVGASGRASWRGQTIETESFNRMRDYAEQNRVLDLWSQVAEASRRYSTATGESELASLEESFGSNLTRMERFEDRASASYTEADNWSAQAAQVRSEAQSIDRDLGQPFFAWLAERPGSDGRRIGVGGALRLATPQTPEEAETLREYAAEFASERLPAPVAPQTASVPGRATFEDAREDIREQQMPATSEAYGGWSEGARDRAGEAAVPEDVDQPAAGAREETDAAMAARAGARGEETRAAEAAVDGGREAVESERKQPMAQQVLEEVPVVGGWLAGRIYGTAQNVSPDEPDGPVDGLGGEAEGSDGAADASVGEAGIPRSEADERGEAAESRERGRN